MKQIFYNLINNTILTNEIPTTEDKALKYLNFITHNNFNYHNDNSYDALDYEKIIYLEETFKDNLEIQEKIKELKTYICKNYIFKKKFQKRIKSTIFNNKNVYSNIECLKEYLYYLPDSLEKK